MDYDGFPCLKRCQSHGNGQVAMINDNLVYGATPADRASYVPAEWFNDHVLGIVVCDLKVRDPQRMRAAWEAGQ